ncbi:hypothetical protein AB0M44_49605 [Streptosporangium subroseum]|uniref:hypothetical protein n=1 Tax=Streptosporangium subroseum TaxID=106412 RepID=UPI003445B16B
MSRYHPRYYAVNDRPVKLEELPAGELAVLVVDFATGTLVRDMSYLSRISDHGIGKDIDSITGVEFEARRVALWQAASDRRHNTPIVWERTGDAQFPYRAELDRNTLIIRVNDFPAEPLYTLLINEVEVEDLEDWPKAWVRPKHPLALLEEEHRPDGR